MINYEGWAETTGNPLENLLIFNSGTVDSSADF